MSEFTKDYLTDLQIKGIEHEVKMMADKFKDGDTRMMEAFLDEYNDNAKTNHVNYEHKKIPTKEEISVSFYFNFKLRSLSSCA